MFAPFPFPRMRQAIVFTDLDGTLLDHATYSFAPAVPALERLGALGIPVILASSKTAAEIAPLQRELGLDRYPAIVENGAGVLWPGETDAQEAARYDRLRAAIHQIDREGLFSGFGDWSAAEIARRTGLDTAAAGRARQRRFSEPGLFRGTQAQLRAFVDGLREAGLDARMGGRFLTISTPVTKAAHMDEITARWFGHGEDVLRIALGDAPNDIEMLQAADIGFIVANPAHAPLPELAGEKTGRILRTGKTGPFGWAEAIGGFLDGHFGAA